MKLKKLGSKGERVLELLQQVDKTKLLEDEAIAKLSTDNETTAKATLDQVTDTTITTTTGTTEKAAQITDPEQPTTRVHKNSMFV